MLHGETLVEAALHARHLAAEQGLVFIHPYDDPAVMAGQGTLALEIAARMPASSKYCWSRWAVAA